MATPRFAWGIDVGNRALKAVKLVREGDILRVDDFEVIEHETVLSNAGDNRESLITAAINSFVQKHPVKGGVVAVGVSGQSSFARFIKLPPVETKKIPEIVRFEAIQQIPFPLDDVEWSYQLFQAEGSPDIEVGIFAMRKELINQHIGYFTNVDLNVQVVQMNPLAVYNAMQFDQRLQGTTMIIDLGAENTDLIIADQDTIWLRSIPIGGNNFTEALVKSFKLNFAKAEDLKRNAATSKYARQIFQAMRPVFADLVAEVQRSIGFYASVHRDSRIKKILTLGGTFKLPGLQKYLQQNLQLDVQRLDTVGVGGPTDPKIAGGFNENVLSVISAYGLALQAMGEGKVTSSLLPQRIRREKLWKEKTKFFAAAAALFVVAAGLGYARYFYDSMRLEGSEGDAKQNERILAEANQLDGEWTTIQQAGSSDRERIKNIRSLENYRDLWTNLLFDIHQTVPVMNGGADELKKTPRASRKQVFIDGIFSRYVPDLTPLMAEDLKKLAITGPGAMPTGGGGIGGFGAGVPMDTPGGLGPGMSDLPGPAPGAAGVAPGAGGAPAAAAAGEGGRGFVLTIRGTTPYGSGPEFLQETITKGLLALTKDKAADAGRSYYIAKAEIVANDKIRNDQSRLTELKSSYDAALKAKEGAFVAPTGGGYVGGGVGEGMGFGRPMDTPIDMPPGQPYAPGGVGIAPGAPAGQDDTKPYLDRVTGEDVRDDWEFTFVALVVLDPPPKQVAAAP